MARRASRFYAHPMTNAYGLTALELAQKIKEGSTSPSKVMAEAITAMDAVNPAINAITLRRDEEALAAAADIERDLEKGIDRGPFAGVPIPIKDLTPVAGWPTTYGSSSTGDPIAELDHPVVAALRRAGFIPCARSNTPEFGSITVTENSRYGITRNPWNLDHTPGGSSGGAAASVAAGIFTVAHANDGGGSIRIPASCTGLVGLKPSRNRVPVPALQWFGASVEGVVTKDLADTAAILDLISGPDPLAWDNAPAPLRPFAQELGADPGKLRIGMVTTAPLGLPIDAEVLAAVHLAAKLLEAAGHELYEHQEPLFPDELIIDFITVVGSGFGDYDNIDPSKLEPHNAHAYEVAQGTNSLDLVAALRRIQLASREIVGRISQAADLILLPTIAIEPPKAGAVLAASHANPEGPPLEVVQMAAFNAPFNMSGQPGISLPIHVSASGLPIGVQLVAPSWGEASLIRVASQLEAAAPWKQRVAGAAHV